MSRSTGASKGACIVHATHTRTRVSMAVCYREHTQHDESDGTHHGSKVMLAAIAPTVAQNPPSGHSSHAVARAAVENRPAGHGSHASSEAGLLLNVPGMQGWHELTSVPDVESLNVPIGQSSGTVVPSGQ